MHLQNLSARSYKHKTDLLTQECLQFFPLSAYAIHKLVLPGQYLLLFFRITYFKSSLLNNLS